MQDLVAAHAADFSPGVRKVLKSEWEVDAVSPGAGCGANSLRQGEGVAAHKSKK